MRLVLLLCALAVAAAFKPAGRATRHALSMEYIPDGLSKAQWEKMKAEEAKKNADKDLGKVGITKFKSRSFEAWQKDGQRHLFPVNPSTPTNEKPYMQRTGGSWDGGDLKGVANVKGQATPMKVTAADRKYEESLKPKPVVAAPVDKKGAVAAKAGAAPKGAVSKVAEEPKKKLFGLF